MLDGNHSLRDHIRAYLGTDVLPRLEQLMSEITEALNRLAEQVNGVSAAQAASFHNLQTAIDDLKAGKLDAEQKEIVGRLEAALVKLGEDAQAGDDGYEPTEAPTQPSDDGDVLPEDLPADPTPTEDGDGTAVKRSR